jgi:hypothetical protein
MLIRDGVKDPGAHVEEDLRRAIESAGGVTDQSMRQVLSDALLEQYQVQPKSPTPAHFLFPFHTAIPGNFRFAGEYKMFRGPILYFLSWRGDGPNSDLIQKLFDRFNDNESLSFVDRLVIGAAKDACGADRARNSATAATLIDAVEGNPDWQHVAQALHSQGPFCSPALLQFQKDLEAVLAIPSLTRNDSVEAIIATLSLHLALYFYRIAYVLFDIVHSILLAAEGSPGSCPACGCGGDISRCPFAGEIRFRVADASRPLRAADGCIISYRSIHAQRLLALPAHLILINLLGRLEAAANPGGRTDFRGLAGRIAEQSELREVLDTATRAMAAIYLWRVARIQDEDALLSRVLIPSSGEFALLDAIRVGYRSSLRRQSTDIANALAKRGGKGFIAVRGAYPFFEIGDEVLLLLTRLIAGSALASFPALVQTLRNYGLAPQDEVELDRLVTALESLSLIRRFSDSGEALYVRDIL